MSYFSIFHNLAKTLNYITSHKKDNIIDLIEMPIKWTSTREQLIREYAQLHYSKDIIDIIPQAVIIHWTASQSWKSTYNYFYEEEFHDGTLNVAAHFLVDRNGTIYKLTPETALNRHAIGYNWCAIGIENVGGFDGIENLTKAQLQANVKLIKYLKNKYHNIKHVWGHYQQEQAKESGLFIENNTTYFNNKIDPGKTFMTMLQAFLKNSDLIFYEL